MLVPLGPDEPLPRKKFSRAEFDQMIEAGLLSGQRVELLDGDLIDKMGQLPPHALALRLLQDAISPFYRPRLVQIRSPIEVRGADREWSLPEPDLAIHLETKKEFGKRFARGDELRLVVEISDTSLRYDLTTKRDLYARAAVREYWVVDINKRRIVVHRNPISGQYLEVSVLTETDEASIGEAKFPVASVMPEA